MSNNKYKSIIFISIFLFSIFYFLFSTPVLAVELKYQFPCSPIAGGTCPTAEQTAQSPAAYIARFYQFALMLAGVLAFGMIIFGAIQYIVSAGNATQQSDARDRIFQALWGIALLFGAYLILYTIDPKLVNLKDPNITKLIVQVDESKLVGGNYKEYGWAQAVRQEGEGGNFSYLCPEGSVHVDDHWCGGTATNAFTFCCASGGQKKATTPSSPSSGNATPASNGIAPGVTRVAPGIIETTGNGGTFQYQWATDATFKDDQKNGWEALPAMSSGICDQIPAGGVLLDRSKAFCVSKKIK